MLLFPTPPFRKRRRPAPPPAAVTPPPPSCALVGGAGLLDTGVTLTFDRPVVLTGGSPDDAITFDGIAATNVYSVDETTLGFDLSASPAPGMAWAIVRQPDWIETEIAVPQDGV